VIDRPRRAAYAEDLQIGHLSEIGAARGLGIGLALGLIVGVVVTGIVPQAVGMNPLAMIVALGLSCAAFGGFVGSLSTS
jgi:F0F1-type ATP synthase assembly protein I